MSGINFLLIDFGLTISLKKTNVLGQDTEAPPVITINDYELDASSPTSAPPSLTTSSWMQRSTKDILNGELALGRRTTGRRHLRYKDVCVRDMKAVDIDTMS